MRYALLLLLTACSSMPTGMTPEQCARYGVEVAGEPTGTVISSEFHTFGGVQKNCLINPYIKTMHQGGIGAYSINQYQLPSITGCAIGVSGTFPDPDHLYRIYYAEHKCAPQHEYCHAAWETSAHTVRFNLRVMQGDKLTMCPGEASMRKFEDKF